MHCSNPRRQAAVNNNIGFSCLWPGTYLPQRSLPVACIRPGRRPNAPPPNCTGQRPRQQQRRHRPLREQWETGQTRNRAVPQSLATPYVHTLLPVQLPPGISNMERKHALGAVPLGGRRPHQSATTQQYFLRESGYNGQHMLTVSV